MEQHTNRELQEQPQELHSAPILAGTVPGISLQQARFTLARSERPLKRARQGPGPGSDTEEEERIGRRMDERVWDFTELSDTDDDDDLLNNSPLFSWEDAEFSRRLTAFETEENARERWLDGYNDLTGQVESDGRVLP